MISISDGPSISTQWCPGTLHVPLWCPPQFFLTSWDLKERGRDIFQPLVYSLDVHNSNIWDMLKPGTWNPTLASHMSGRELTTLGHPLLLHRHIRRKAGSEVEYLDLGIPSRDPVLGMLTSQVVALTHCATPLISLMLQFPRQPMALIMCS